MDKNIVNTKLNNNIKNICLDCPEKYYCDKLCLKALALLEKNKNSQQSGNPTENIQYVDTGLIKRIKTFEYYVKEFATWEATEQIIDKKKAFWSLQKPGSEYRKVCLFRDGCNMFVYGDYGQFTFDSMTWLGSVYNLNYDNIGYQMEKLNSDSRQSLYIYDEDACEEDILKWLEENLKNNYNIESEQISEIVEYFKNNTDYNYSLYDIHDFCERNSCEELNKILEFTVECIENTDEYEWIAFLRRSNLNDFDEINESSLWKAGKRTHQRYFINMYALYVCGQKLLEEKGKQKTDN